LPESDDVSSSSRFAVSKGGFRQPVSKEEFRKLFSKRVILKADLPWFHRLDRSSLSDGYRFLIVAQSYSLGAGSVSLANNKFPARDRFEQILCHPKSQMGPREAVSYVTLCRTKNSKS